MEQVSNNSLTVNSYKFVCLNKRKMQLTTYYPILVHVTQGTRAMDLQICISLDKIAEANYIQINQTGQLAALTYYGFENLMAPDHTPYITINMLNKVSRFWGIAN